LKVLFCGINPSGYSAAAGHHFAGPGNRFWKTLCAAGFTPRLLTFCEDRQLLQFGLGSTNLVSRATRSAAEIKPEEYPAGRLRLEKKVRRYRPQWLAVLGKGAYAQAFERKKVEVGEQVEHTIGETRVWVLPNPSGLNGWYVHTIATHYAELRKAIG
jgi:TDG/mug DNA glycosylase family protein